MGAGEQILEALKRLEAKIDGLWADVEAIKLARAAPAARAAGGKPSKSDAIDDGFLDANEWADRIVKRDPSRWKSDVDGSFVGSKYSQCPSDYLECMASFCDWKASKGREDPEPRLQTQGKNAGRPWYEADEFEAKICRAWARRNVGKIFSAPTPTQAALGDDPLPF